MDHIIQVRTRLPEGQLHLVQLNWLLEGTAGHLANYLGRDLGVPAECLTLKSRNYVPLARDDRLDKFLQNPDFDYIDVAFNGELADMPESVRVKVMFLRTMNQRVFQLPKNALISDLRQQVAQYLQTPTANLDFFMRHPRPLFDDVSLDMLRLDPRRDYLLCSTERSDLDAALLMVTANQNRDVVCSSHLRFTIADIKSTRHAQVALFKKATAASPGALVPCLVVYNWVTNSPAKPVVTVILNPRESLEFETEYYVTICGLQTIRNQLTALYKFNFVTEKQILNLTIDVPGRGKVPLQLNQKTYPDVAGLYNFLRDEANLFTDFNFELVEVSENKGTRESLKRETLLSTIEPNNLFAVPIIPLVLPKFEDEPPTPGEESCLVCLSNRPQVSFSCGHIFCRACSVSLVQKKECHFCRSVPTTATRVFCRVKENSC